MKYGYTRVSTLHQDLEAQWQTLRAEGCDEIYSEKFTGTKANRPQFQEVLWKLQDGDTSVVTKLDRFARSSDDGVKAIKELPKRGVKAHVLNMSLVEDTPIGRLIPTIMSGFAEFKRDMIMERTHEGKAIARQREGFREDRPN